MNYWLGIDDTDNLESRGTGHLARFMAQSLAIDFEVAGVTRHQLLDDPRVPMTAKNSCAAILFSGPAYPLADLAAYVRKMMLDDFQPGSDPGYCLGTQIAAPISAFGQRAQRQVVRQQEARQLAASHGLWLEGLAGTQDGVIGALAAVGLAALGEDGRYVLTGKIRELEGLVTVDAILAAGIQAVLTMDGSPVTQGLVLADRLRPARRQARPVLYVEAGENGHWQPLKLN
ncbi:MAG: hypothetical protein JW862_17725 [Anaerolineales bacterium]|nr:hypothetical protein [Anaerolineales bacterium]